MQAGRIHSEARKSVQRLQTKGGTGPPHVWRTDMQSSDKGAPERPGSGDHALAEP